MKFVSFLCVLLFATNLVNSQTTNYPTPKPGNQCAPFVFPNGSSISLSNPFLLVGWFPQMLQSAGGNYDWGMSLCDVTIQASGSPACARGNNMVQSPQCVLAVAGNPAISAMGDGSGVTFIFPPAWQADNNFWFNTVNCVCDPTKSSLNSPSNAYAITVNIPNVAATWMMSSSGCCIDYANTTTVPPNTATTTTTTTIPTTATTTTLPPTTTIPTTTTTALVPASTCPPFTFINGSVVSLNNYAKLAAEFPQMAQQGTGGSFDWAMSLCAPQYQVQSAPACATGFYMSRSSTCTAQISTSRAIVVSPDGYALQFKFSPAPQSDGYTWTNVVTCLCDRSSFGLVSPSNSYYVSVQGVQVNATWTVTSDACCVETQSTTTTALTTPTTSTTTTTTTTTTTAEPTTSNPPSITCTPVNFPNGSKISFGDPTTMSQYWPALQQVGDVVGTYPWSVSLCDPTIQMAGAMSCAKGNYMAQNPDCSFMFTAANTPTIAALADGAGVAFTFAPVLVTGNTWSAVVTCVCDPNCNNIYAPSGNYRAAVSGTSGNVIALTWILQSKGCCIDPAPTTTTTTTSTSTTTTTTTPSPSGSNNNNNNNGNNSNNNDDNAALDEKSFAFGAAGGVAGLVILLAIIFFVKKACTNTPAEATNNYQISFNPSDELHAP